MLRKIIAYVVLSLASCGCFAQSAEELRVETRFGALTLDNQDRLIFKGRLILPVMRANSGMDAGKPFHFGATDVFLVTIVGGTACPYLYHLVTVTQSRAQATHAFGTCNEALLVKRDGNSIVVTMHGYRGPFEPEAEKRKAMRETHTFVFHNGAVSEDGKPVKGGISTSNQ